MSTDKKIQNAFNTNKNESIIENHYIEFSHNPRSEHWLYKLAKKKESAGEPIGEPNCTTIYPNK